MNATAPASAPSLDAILAALPKGLDPREAAQLPDFMRAFFARVPADEIDSRAPAAWVAIARWMLAFLQQRPVGQPMVKVVNAGSETFGLESSHTLIQIANDDMPFLVDSVRLALTQFDISLHEIVHPVVAIERDGQGKLVAVGKGAAESLMYLEIDRQADQDVMTRLEQAIIAALADVRACVADWAAMRDRMVAIADDLSARPMPATPDVRAEAQEFLRWAADNHFTFLGYREYRREGGQLLPVAGSSLGLMRGKESSASARPVTGLAAAESSKDARIDPLILTKTNARATVHRPGYMDYIGVLKFDAEGNAIAEQRFLGLYTSSAYNRRPWDIPLVRQRYEYVMQASGLSENSHSGKALRHILETLPREELFQATAEELRQTAMGILGLQERVRPRLFLRRDRHGRFYSALAYIPRDRFNTLNRQRIEAMLMRELQGERLDNNIQMGESPLAQLHMVIRPKAGSRVDFDVARLEAELVKIVRDWHDELREAMIAHLGEERGIKLFQRYGRNLPASYIEAVPPDVAAMDLRRVSQLSGDDALRLRLYQGGNPGMFGFKLIRHGGDIALSDALPMMENLGVRILTEHPYKLDIDGERISIQDFEIQPYRDGINIEEVRLKFEEAFRAVWQGDAENDGFNRLVILAGLDWREVAMLRGYCKYLLQTGVPFSQAYMEETLARYPLIARLLAELFESRFDPVHDTPSADKVETTRAELQHQLEFAAHESERSTIASIIEQVAHARGLDRGAQLDACEDALAALLEKVASLDEDRILRNFMAVINATLRTNFFQRKPIQSKGAHGGHTDYIAFKFDPAKVPDLPKPRPYREIFVYSPWVEGVHLRFGPVARGGLRWSDRREDFRTEVLGLVKAQMVKNTVIVPVGSKGGFFPKRMPVGGDRDAVMAEGIASYKRFINALLDITDNIVDGVVVPPVDVVRHDMDDPYLVVAADKGTATFSDIANGISAEHGFWLGDAFASGGSVGYDHKAMGITAKGGWESVKRHFRALGIDCQSQDFTCVGVGDMSGDVFGNGMLLSKHIRLLAAFDHRHIFIDPNPDSAISFAERERLFKLPRSSWDDYDKSLISPGGGVFPRSAKSLNLSAEAKAALGIDASVEQMTPAELMNAILKAPVDLLWNGGIGTYVKASSETHAQCGDRANNLLRVDGNELRCKMVGEGGNLGMTQKGRIEAAQNGVLLNTDFIDNSAGVDTSDHEVNIKILLGAIVQRGELTMAQRNTLLASMTNEVGEQVLNDNYRQNQAISLMERMSAARLGSFGHFIRTLESEGLLDRAIEFLPSDAELTERKARGQGLTRPELSILLSYDKIVLFNQLLDSDVPEDPYLSKELLRYFPGPLQERYPADMENHRLRREIIATAATNSMVNRMGATFVLRMHEDTGATPAEIAKAYSVSREVLDTRSLWAAIDALDLKVPENAQIEALMVIWQLQRSMTRWLLNTPGQTLNIAQLVERFGPGMAALRASLSGVLSNEARAARRARTEHWQQLGFPDTLAVDLASLPYLAYGLDIIEVAADRKLPVPIVAEAYFALSDALHSAWLMESIESLPVDSRWHAQARGVLRDELQAQQRILVGQVLALAGKGDTGEAGLHGLVAQWLNRDDAALRYTLSMFADMRTLRSLDYPILSVAVRRLAQVAAAGARAS